MGVSIMVNGSMAGVTVLAAWLYAQFRRAETANEGPSVEWMDSIAR